MRFINLSLGCSSPCACSAVSALASLASLSKLDSEEIARLDRETRAKLKALKQEMNTSYSMGSTTTKRSPKSKTADSSPRDSASDIPQAKDKLRALKSTAYTIDSSGEARTATPKRSPKRKTSDSSPRDSASDIPQARDKLRGTAYTIDSSGEAKAATPRRLPKRKTADSSPRDSASDIPQASDKLRALKSTAYTIDSSGEARTATPRRSPKRKTSDSSPRDSASDLPQTRDKLRALKSTAYTIESSGEVRTATPRRLPKNKTVDSSPRDSVSDLPQARDKLRAVKQEMNSTYTIDSGDGTRAATPRRSPKSKIADSSPKDSASDIPQATKETVPRKKKKKLEFQLDEQPRESQASSKPPLPPNSMETSVSSAPLPSKQLRRTRRRSSVCEDESGYVTSGDDSPKRKRANAQLASSLTQSTTASANGSPVLDELHPFSNPERALRVALKDVDSDDWSSKCDGLLAVRRLAMFHPDVLTPQLHTATLAVEREVIPMHPLPPSTVLSLTFDPFAPLPIGEEPPFPGGQSCHCLFR